MRHAKPVKRAKESVSKYGVKLAKKSELQIYIAAEGGKAARRNRKKPISLPRVSILEDDKTE